MARTEQLPALGLGLGIMSTGHALVERNANGTVPARDLKAVSWYAVRHGLKPAATNVFPEYTFKDREGREVTVHLNEIRKTYKDFREAEKRKRSRKTEA